MGKLTLVLGGARSGKSTFAEQLARDTGGESVLYVATAEVLDDEMRDRVQKHQQRRPASWRTLEATENVGARIREAAGDARTVLVDCLAVLSANPLMQPDIDPFDPAIEAQVVAEVDALADVAAELPAEFIVVSNEVGMGVVPPTPLGRAYRDILGRANQRIAARAEVVYLLVAGIPMQVK